MINLKITTPIVSVDWLNYNLNDDDLIVLDGTIPKIGKKPLSLEDKKQIKGARFFDIKKVFSGLNLKTLFFVSFIQLTRAVPTLKLRYTSRKSLASRRAFRSLLSGFGFGAASAAKESFEGVYNGVAILYYFVDFTSDRHIYVVLFCELHHHSTSFHTFGNHGHFFYDFIEGATLP